ncbi:MAG TPA: hypothetical protein VGW74_06355 [Propionibacteriaceae bacterium]|nr:hypothetical protein [Propionibacteriaceae bacterium]
MVQINKTSEHVRVTREYAITDAEPMKLLYRRTLVRPDELVVEFVDGSWSSARIIGRNVRQDGSVGDNRHASEYGDYDQEHLPEWAVPLTKYEEE